MFDGGTGAIRDWCAKRSQIAAERILDEDFRCLTIEYRTRAANASTIK
jgi:hypothetical protein